jgi:hypothetical protein
MLTKPENSNTRFVVSASKPTVHPARLERATYSSVDCSSFENPDIFSGFLRRSVLVLDQTAPNRRRVQLTDALAARDDPLLRTRQPLCNRVRPSTEFSLPGEHPFNAQMEVRSSHARPTPKFSNPLRCFGVAASNAGYHETGVIIIRPSESQTSTADSVMLASTISKPAAESVGDQSRIDLTLESEFSMLL